MRQEVLSSVGAHDTNTRGFELHDLEEIQFSWEETALDMDNVYRPGIDTPFSPSTFDDFQMGSTAVNPIIVDAEEVKKNSASTTTTTTECERSTKPPRLLKNCPFGTRIENLRDSVYRNCISLGFVCVRI